MYSETYRPTTIDDVIGHKEQKEVLKQYLSNPPFRSAVMLYGPPGIGKTTIALSATKSFGFDPLEINASRSIRSYEDVERIKDACRSSVNIHSFLRGERQKLTCVILDEVDGSDPHAQNKIIEWIKDPSRKVPIVCTGNELPTIFKRNLSHILSVRCFPPRASDVEHLFPSVDVETLLKECQYDIRRIFHRMQYGESDPIPKYVAPPTGLPIEKAFIGKQMMFQLPDPLAHVYRADTLDTVHSWKTNSVHNSNDKHVHTAESCNHHS
jgi:replication-associated recombination protein RarA